jgi:hypothetical protein
MEDVFRHPGEIAMELQRERRTPDPSVPQKTPPGFPLHDPLTGRSQRLPGDPQEVNVRVNAWTPLSPATLPPPERPLLVTNNVTGTLNNGQMSTLWLVWTVHYTPPRDGSRGEFYAYTREGELLRWLTHWRLAVPEEG